MENNFYVGNIIRKKKKSSDIYVEKMVLYTQDNIYYIDLINDITYTTNNFDKSYVDSSSLVSINTEDFRIDYMYLLLKHNEGNNNNNNNNKRKFSKKIEKLTKHF